MYCIKCGKQITDNSKFCEHCGAPQETEISQAPVLPSEKEIEEAEKDILEAEALIAEAQVQSDEITDFIHGNKEEEKTAQPDDIESFLKTNGEPQAPDYSVPLNENANYGEAEPAAEPSAQGSDIPKATPLTYAAQTQQNQTNYQPASSQTSYQSSYQAPPKKKKPVLLIVLIVIALLGGIFGKGLGSGSRMDGPEDVIEAYFRAVGNSDKEAIVDLMPQVWYDHLRDEYPSDSEYWQECDYSWRANYFGYKLDEYDYDVKEEYTSSDVASINQAFPGFNAERIVTYNVYAYFTNGDSDLFYIDMAVIDGDWYLVEAW